MDFFLEGVLPRLVEFAVPMIEGAILVIVALGFNLLRKAPAVLRTALKSLEEQAAKTETPLDDAAVQFVRVGVEAFGKALDQHVPPPKAKLK